MNDRTRNGLVWLCGAAMAGVLWLASREQSVSQAFALIGIWLALIALVQIARGLLSD